VRCVALRDQIFETEIGFYGLHATRVFRVQPRNSYYASDIKSTQISVPRLCNSKKSGSAAVSERWNMHGPGISPSGALNYFSSYNLSDQ
jgi:hypothetical protein